MKTKKVLSLILTVIILVSCTAFASDALNTSVTVQNGAYDEAAGQLTVDIIMHGAADVSSVDFTVEYDKAVLKYVSMTTDLEMWECNPSTDGKLIVSGLFEEKCAKTDAKAASVVFELKKSAKTTDIEITEFLAENDTESVSFSQNVSLDISGCTPKDGGVRGDVNGDGKLTTNDVKAVLRHVAGLKILEAAQQTVADFNSDGKVTTNDAKKMLRTIAGLE